MRENEHFLWWNKGSKRHIPKVRSGAGGRDNGT